MFNALDFLNNYGITHWTEGKNCQEGWVNVRCPVPGCMDMSNHGGFNLAKGYYNCWICGKSKLEYVVSLLAGVPVSTAKDIIKEYDVSYNIRLSLNRNKKEKKVIDKIKLPGSDLKKVHKRYLRRRDFDPDFIIKKYGITGTGIVGDWKYRIIIPIVYENNIVSFQGRDITDQQELRYRTLSKEESIIDPKTIFYNLDNCGKNKVIVTEGVFDVWRMGDDCIASLGSSITKDQIRLLRKRFDKIYFLFDPEDEAIKKAEKACDELASFGKYSELIVLAEGDPADLTDKEAKRLKEEILK